MAAVRAGFPRVVVPAENAGEARLVPGAEIRPVGHLLDVLGLHGGEMPDGVVTPEDGTEGARAQKTRKLGGMLEKIIDLPVVYWDERNTTKSAETLLSATNTYGKKRKELLDTVAASIILESYLDYRRNQSES